MDSKVVRMQPEERRRPIGRLGSVARARLRSACSTAFQRSSSVDFFFPDSQDQIDPSFDFQRESGSRDRVRQRDDRYAHEVISPAPYSGVLLSKALVDGPGSKYTFAQRHRLYRLGVRRFFRLDEHEGPRLATLGDCGAFNYVREELPPYSVDDVAAFYTECGFDLGIFSSRRTPEPRPSVAAGRGGGVAVAFYDRRRPCRSDPSIAHPGAINFCIDTSMQVYRVGRRNPIRWWPARLRTRPR
jgi:hypothetical protein